MLNPLHLLSHGAPFGPWESPSTESLIKAAAHVREALAAVAYLRARYRAGTSISPGIPAPLEQQPALLSPTPWRGASRLGNQSTYITLPIQGPGNRMLQDP